MKVKVNYVFFDITNPARKFNPGEVVDFDEERAERIISLGLGEKEEAPKEADVPKKEEAPKEAVKKPRKKKE